MNYILCCTCHGQEKQATDAFSVIFPNLPIPQVVKGRDHIYKLSETLDNQHIKAISRLKGKYAFYIELDDNNVITKEYNLITGRRIA